MKIIRSATQGEVVLSFLQGEFESARFGEELRQVLDFFDGTFGYVGKVPPEEMCLYDSRMI